MDFEPHKNGVFNYRMLIGYTQELIRGIRFCILFMTQIKYGLSLSLNHDFSELLTHTSMFRKILRNLWILIVILLLYGGLKFFTLADIRPENYSYPTNVEKAKGLLKEMAVAHRTHLWDSIQTYSVNFEDEFFGFVGKQAHPFAEQNMKFKFRYTPKTPLGQLQIVNGANSGTIWGVENGKIYRNTSEGGYLVEENTELQFWIPTYKYFIELPARIQEASIIDYVGNTTINGIAVEGVLISWNSAEPQKEVDQYIVWIATNSKRIIKVAYTVRDAYPFVSGAAFYTEYKEFDGFLLPTVYPVESNLVSDGFLHEMRLTDFKPDDFPKSDLEVLE